MDNVNSTVDAAYENMLNIADSISSEGITEKSVKDFESLKDSVNQVSFVGDDNSFNPGTITVATDNDEIVDVRIDHNENDIVYLNQEKVMTSYDPVSGETRVVDESADIAQKIISNQFQNLKDGNETNVGAEIVKEVLHTDEFTKSDDENTQIATLLTRRLVGEEFDYYNEAPESFKKEIDKIYADLMIKQTKNVKVLSKKSIAKMVLDGMVEDLKKDTNTQLDLDTLLSGFDEDVKKMTNEMSTELGGMMMTLDEERKAEIDAAIKRCTDEGKMDAVQNLQDIRDTIDSAYDLTGFIEACKNIKIKNYDMKEPKRVWDYFNNKYTNSKMVINDIRSCPDILVRHVDYTLDQCTVLCLAFCKYCQNMSPNNMKDHTFMYYFIRNIVAIDRLNPKGNLYESLNEPSKKFYDGFVANIKLAMDNILERNPNFK